MRYVLLTTAALLALPASAADLKAQPRSPAPGQSATDWSGFYLGGHGGWSSVTIDPISVDADGFVWGGHAGVNFQRGHFVGGLEVGITNYANVKASGSGCDCLVADLLVKAGVTLTQNWLLYGTGGGFWHNAQTFGVLVPSVGWAVGAGTDWKPLGNHFVVGARYLYRDLGTNNHPFSVAGHEFTGRVGWQF